MTDPTEEAWRCPWCGVGRGACCAPSPKPPPDLRCTRDPGHKGRHVACGREPADVRHEPLAVWGTVAIDPIDAIYEKAQRDAKYREALNRELDGFGMPWLKALEGRP